MTHTEYIPFGDRDKNTIKQVQEDLKSLFSTMHGMRTTTMNGILDRLNQLPKTNGCMTAIKGKYILEKIFMEPLIGAPLANGLYTLMRNTYGSYYIDKPVFNTDDEE